MTGGIFSSHAVSELDERGKQNKGGRDKERAKRKKDRSIVEGTCPSSFISGPLCNYVKYIEMTHTGKQ